MMKNWMIFILAILLILSNIWREHQVEATMERGEQRYEQTVLMDSMKIERLQTIIDYGMARCYNANWRGHNVRYCGLVNPNAQ